MCGSMRRALDDALHQVVDIARAVFAALRVIANERFEGGLAHLDEAWRKLQQPQEFAGLREHVELRIDQGHTTGKIVDDSLQHFAGQLHEACCEGSLRFFSRHLRLLFEQFRKLPRRHGLAEIKALEFVARPLAQKVHLRLGFHTLGDDGQT